MPAYTKDAGTDFGQTIDRRDATVTDQVIILSGFEQGLGHQVG